VPPAAVKAASIGATNCRIYVHWLGFSPEPSDALNLVREMRQFVAIREDRSIDLD